MGSKTALNSAAFPAVDLIPFPKNIHGVNSGVGKIAGTDNDAVDLFFPPEFKIKVQLRPHLVIGHLATVAVIVKIASGIVIFSGRA